MNGAPTLDVLEGALAAIQDAGRPGWARFGVPPGGACDPDGFAVANALLDNPESAAAVEIALGGFAFAARDTTVVAIGGADLGAVVVEEDRRLAPGASHLVHAGRTVRFEGRPAGLERGARAYLAVAGGFDVPLVMGSRATHVVGGLGGMHGRGLRAGDTLLGRRAADPSLAGRRWPGGDSPPPGRGIAGFPGPAVVRVVAGPHLDRLARDALERFLDSEWITRSEGNRMGVRLAGPPVRRRRSPDLVSLPMTWGAIQVPPDGAPIVLLVDHQTVGGYPLLAIVIRADRSVVGQLAPGDRVRFQLVDIEQAQVAWREGRARFRAALERLAANELWSDQWRWAGA